MGRPTEIRDGVVGYWHRHWVFNSPERAAAEQENLKNDGLAPTRETRIREVTSSYKDGPRTMYALEIWTPKPGWTENDIEDTTKQMPDLQEGGYRLGYHDSSAASE